MLIGFLNIGRNFEVDLELLSEPIHPNVKRFIVPLLRRRWMYWPARSDAIRAAKVAPNRHKCNICKKDDFKRNELHVDHISPVRDVMTSMKTWYDLIMFIIRLFVDADKLQILCITCHAQKTKIEMEMRKFYRKEEKSRNKKKSRQIKK